MVKSDEEGVTKEVEEFIYPTEYDPNPFFTSPQNNVVVEPAPLMPLPVLGTSWETKDTGHVVQAGVTELPQGWLVTTSIYEVSQSGFDQYGRENGVVQFPRFSVQALRTRAFVKRNVPTLLGTFSRAPQDGRLWLVFLTARPTR